MENARPSRVVEDDEHVRPDTSTGSAAKKTRQSATRASSFLDIVHKTMSQNEHLDVPSLNFVGAGQFKRTTTFQRGVIDILYDQDSQRKRGDCWRLFSSVGLLLVFVLISANDNVVKAASKVRVHPGEPRRFLYAPASVVLMASVFSVVAGTALSAVHRGWDGVQSVWNFRTIVRMAPASALFTIAQVLKFLALKYMPVDMMVLVDQFSLVVLALMMRFMMGKRYSPPQWCCLVIVSVSMLQYMSLSDHAKKKNRPADPLSHAGLDLSGNLYVGLVLMLLQVFISVVASVLCETLLKAPVGPGGGPPPFWEQQGAMQVSGSVVSVLWSYAAAPVLLNDTQVFDNGLFGGWDTMTCLVLVMMIAKLWLAGLIAKMLDSVVKQLGSCIALLLIYFEQVFLPAPWGSGMLFDYDVFVALLVVALCIGSFGVAAKYEKDVEKGRDRLRDIERLAEPYARQHLDTVELGQM
eukprot:TRINITY_DN50725_c0_g1_i1.p1 TRINITY_DN50725_c0_g1~~TRINITY_DN50725_c0_g1_i1.p1  ORF type:complete len:466 (+),score=90.49 TRINITY_DN50725_c0_g1_i1:145-1542(+)